MKNSPKEPVRIPVSFYRNFFLLLALSFNLNLNAQTTCPVAESVAVSTITSTSVRINYNLSANVSSAAIEYGTTTSFGDWKSVPIYKTATYWDLTNLNPGTKYYYHIKSICNNTEVNITPGVSGLKDFTTYPVTTCPAATNLSVTEITAATARINYSLSPNIGSAALEISSTNNSSIRTINLEVRSTYYDLADLAASTTYYFRIKTVCTNTPGIYSPVYTNNITFKTLALPVCAAATNLSVTDITAVSAGVHYTLPSDLSSATFEIRPSTSTAYSSPIPLSPTATSSLCDGLTAMTKYSVRIKTVCKNGGTNVAETTFTTLATPVCAAATNLSISDILSTGAIVSYKLPTEINHATLEITSANSTTVTGSNQTWKSIPITNISTTYQFLDLAPGTRYYTRVRTVCANGSENISSVLYFTTLAVPNCTAATGLSVTDISAISARINFTLHGEVKIATLQIRPVSSTAYLNINIPIPSVYLLRNELTALTKYYYKIKTVCADGTILYTDETSFTTLAAPTCVAATNLTDSGISSVGAVIGYTLPREIKSATLEILAANTASPTANTANWQTFPLGLTSTTYDLKGLTPLTLYYFRIKTECANGSFIYSAVPKFTTLATLTCTAATNVSISNITSSTARFNFKLPAGILGAFVEIQVPGSTTWLSRTITSLTSTYYDHNELTPLTNYYYRIRTVCSNGAVNYSEPGNFATIAESACTPATNVTASNITAVSVRINFTLPQNISSAAVEIKAPNSTWVTYPLSSLTLTLLDRGDLLPSTLYAYRIRTTCAGTAATISPVYSPEAHFTTLAAAPCAAATIVSVGNISQNGAYVVYTLPKEIKSATLELISANTTTLTGSSSTRSIILIPGTTSYELKELTPSTRYYVTISIVCPQGSTSISNSLGFNTLAATTCTAATNLSVSNIYSASVRINFTLPQGITSAAVEIMPPGTTTWSSYGITNLSATYYDRRELSPLTRYSYRIKTVCTNGTVTYSTPGDFTTIAESSCIPATNSVSNITATGAKINFTLPKNTSNAVLEINSSNYPNWQPITLPLASTVYELTQLYSATRYAFRIKTVCVNGTGTDQIMYSTEGNFYTLSATACGAATNVSYSIVSNTNVHIYFTLPKNISSAALEITSLNHTDVWSDLAIIDLTSAYYNLEGLTAGTTYYFRIKTVCSDMLSPNSVNYTPAATFTTSNNKDAVVDVTVPTTQSPGDLGVSCYPNPASTDISITITGVSGELVDLKISNIYGLIVYQGKYPENTVQKIDVQSYPRGIYVIRVSQSGKTNAIKVAIK